MNEKKSNHPFDYQEIFNHSPSGIIILDNNGIILNANQKTAEWLNTTVGELVGKNVFMVRSIPKESKVKILEKISQRLEGEEILPYEIKFKGKTGETRLATVSEQPILDADGRLDQIHVVMSDVTNLRKEGAGAEEDLIYRTVFDYTPLAITVVDRDERIISWNKFTEELLGMQKADLQNKAVSSLYAPGEWERIGKLNIRLKGLQSHLEAKVLHKDGRILDVAISIGVLKDKEGKTIGSIGVMRDISERIKAEHEAHAAQSKYQTIFDHSSVAIMLADGEERIISCNNYTEKLLGFTKEEISSKLVRSLYPEEEWQRIRSSNIRQKGMQSHLETKMLKKDGSVLDVDISLSVLKDAAGKVTGSIGIIVDITERKMIERELASTLKMKGQFLSMVSHELRTPLTAIKGSLEIVLEGATGPVTADQKDFLSTALNNLDRLDKQISEVLDYQRLESGRESFDMKEANINFILQQLERKFMPMAKERGLELKVLTSDSTPDSVFDENKILRVLENLTSNAIKYTEKGSIQLSVEVIEGDKLGIHIQDTGIGIKKEDMEKIFTPFGQVSTGDGRKPGNLGLGLVISRSIVKHHGGDIQSQSEPGKGSTFTVILPKKPKI